MTFLGSNKEVAWVTHMCQLSARVGKPEVCSCIMGRLPTCLSCHFILAVVTLSIAGGCQLTPFGGTSRPIHGNSPPVWSGCVSNCTPADFKGEIHILRQKSGAKDSGHTIVDIGQAIPWVRPAKLILILVSEEKTNWILVPAEGIHISQIVTITRQPGRSAATVHRQRVRVLENHAAADLEVFLRGIQMRVGPLPIYSTSHARTSSTPEWKLYVGLADADRPCPSLNIVADTDSSSSHFKHVVKRVIVTASLLLFIAIAVTVICFLQRRRAKKNERRRPAPAFLPPPTVVAATEPPLEPHTIESTAPPPYTPYEPPPAYETVREKRSSTQRDKRRSRSRSEKARKDQPARDKSSSHTVDD